jgi:hypothetical protein
VESVNHDELEIELRYESFNANIQGPKLLPVAKGEYYEVFPYNSSQGKVLQVMYKSLTLFAAT